MVRLRERVEQGGKVCKTGRQNNKLPAGNGLLQKIRENTAPALVKMDKGDNR